MGKHPILFRTEQHLVSMLGSRQVFVSPFYWKKMRATDMFNTLCGRSRLRCALPFLILKSMINFRDWNKEITCYKLNMDFSLSKQRMTGDAKPRMKLLNGFIKFTYKKNQNQTRWQKMHAAKQKIRYNFKIMYLFTIYPSTEPAVFMSWLGACRQNCSRSTG